MAKIASAAELRLAMMCMNATSKDAANFQVHIRLQLAQSKLNICALDGQVQSHLIVLRPLEQYGQSVADFNFVETDLARQALLTEREWFYKRRTGLFHLLVSKQIRGGHRREWRSTDG